MVELRVQAVVRKDAVRNLDSLSLEEAFIVAEAGELATELETDWQVEGKDF